MGDEGTPSIGPRRPVADVQPSPMDKQLRLDALPEGLASPVFKSFARSAASAASREIAHKLFRTSS